METIHPTLQLGRRLLPTRPSQLTLPPEFSPQRPTASLSLLSPRPRRPRPLLQPPPRQNSGPTRRVGPAANPQTRRQLAHRKNSAGARKLGSASDS